MKNTLQIPLISFLRKLNIAVFILFAYFFYSPALLAQMVTYTFTPCGALGAAGPTQLQVNNTYTVGNNLNGSVTVLGQGIQQFTVPIAGNYRIEARGARGYNPSGLGGRGAIMSGDFSFTAGTVLKIAVGQEGQVNPAAGTLQFGGGGGSFVSLLNNTPLIVAGGGGGSHATSYAAGSADGTVSTTGNTAVGSAAGAGGVAGGGGAASSSANGGAGFYGDGGGTTGPAVSFTNGALGGNVGAIAYANGGIGGFGGGGGTQSWNNDRGGGGGGYSGGGGGQLGAPSCWGGGGGSYNIGTNQTNLSGANTFSNGLVLITRLCNITLGTTSGITSICQGAAVTLTTDAISSYTWSTGSNAASILISPIVTTSYTLTAMSPSNCITSAVITITVSSVAPTLTVTNSSPSVCLGNTATLTATGALTYTWTGGVSNGVSFSPLTSQVYTVSGQNGCGITTATTAITIAPLPVVALASPTLVCAGTTATLSGGGATTYTWQPGNIVGANVLVSPQANTIYTVTGGTGACIGIFTVNMSTNPNPTLTATASQSINICVGTSVTLTATGALGYTWQPGGLTGASIVVTPTAPIAYVVTGTNNFNCSSSVSQVVITSQNPTITAVANNTAICVGGSATLTAGGADAYAWNTGALTGVTVVSPIVNTVYSVVGTNTASGCSNTQTLSITVFVATLSVSAPTAVCLGASVTLNASGATSYTWSNGSNSNSIFVGPLVTTNYNVNGISNIGNMSCSSSGSTTVTVNPIPNVAAVCTRTNICRNEFASITATGASTYLWSNTSTNTVLSVNPIVTTNYSVTGTDANGCVNSATIQIKVSLCTGVNEINTSANSGIVIFPNPSNGEFNIKAEKAMDLNLVNELGQVIRTIELNAANNYQTTLRDLAKGVYFIVAKNKQDLISQKVIIQ